jgi:hypothetical protein
VVVEIGDVFLPSDSRINEHPRVIISHPESDPNEVVLVNFTGDDEFYKDDSCIIQPSEHSWLTKPTCISYRDAKLAKESDLDHLIKNGRIRQLEPASNDLIKKILEGAEKTEFLPGKCKRVLERQGLIGS